MIGDLLVETRAPGGSRVTRRAFGGVNESELCIVEARAGAVYRVDLAALGA